MYHNQVHKFTALRHWMYYPIRNPPYTSLQYNSIQKREYLVKLIVEMFPFSNV